MMAILSRQWQKKKKRGGGGRRVERKKAEVIRYVHQKDCEKETNMATFWEKVMSINPYSLYLSSLSSLSHLKLTPSKGVVPPGFEPGTLHFL